MKVLKIENGKGLFINPKKIKENEDLNVQYKVIDQITKEDILDMLDYLIIEEIEMDVYCEKDLPNPAQQIIYNNLFQNFSKTIENKNQLMKEVNEAFSLAEKKYCG